VFGLLGEGVLPPLDFARSITSVGQALAGHSAPTAVLTRSKSNDSAINPSQWLPDTFITQVWCNAAMMTGWGLDNEAFQDSTLLEILPRLLHAHHDSQYTADAVFVDGTSVLPSAFDLEGEGDGDRQKFTVAGNTAAADGGSMYIGTLRYALVRAGETAVIGVAPWPPSYVLETAVLDTGLIVVNNVNCGYLDFAINFFTSARKVLDNVKVRH